MLSSIMIHKSVQKEREANKKKNRKYPIQDLSVKPDSSPTYLPPREDRGLPLKLKSTMIRIMKKPSKPKPIYNPSPVTTPKPLPPPSPEIQPSPLSPCPETDPNRKPQP